MKRKTMWWLALGAAMIFSQAMQAESWHATVGGQSSDKGMQALAFLPNEMWIHAGDSITWTFPSDEKHSVTFLKTGQTRPNFQIGCPGTADGTTPDGSVADGSACVNSGLITVVGSSYTVSFPTPGNYTVLCLLHVNMSGTIHVLNPGDLLPHDQDFYDRQAAAQQRDLLTDRDGGLARKFREGSPHDEENAHAHHNMIVTGTGEVVSTPGGAQSVSMMRFMQPSITIHAGETVEWDSSDVSGHSITFGAEPLGGYTPLSPPTKNVFSDADGSLHAVVSSTEDVVHSGKIAPASQERTGSASASGVTRFRVTFTRPGTYPYICAFHDELGMKGEVIVLP